MSFFGGLFLAKNDVEVESKCKKTLCDPYLSYHASLIEHFSYSCVLSCLAFEWKRGCPCFETSLIF